MGYGEQLKKYDAAIVTIGETCPGYARALEAMDPSKVLFIYTKESEEALIRTIQCGVKNIWR